MGLPNPLIKYEINIDLGFNQETPEDFSKNSKLLESVIPEMICYKLKENGLVTYFNKIKLKSLNKWKSGFQLEIFIKVFNISFVHINFINQSPSFRDAEKIEDFITEILAKKGYAPKIDVELNRIITEEANELITSNPISETLLEAEIEDHFHLVIPNKSGYGWTSVHDPGGRDEHYHIVREFEVGPAIKNGKEIEMSHKHILPRFIPGHYSTSGLFYGDDSNMIEHKHENVYLDEFGIGFIDYESDEDPLYNHTHRVINGVIYPANDIEGYHMHHFDNLI